MKKSEESLLALIVESAKKGESFKILAEHRKDAENLVEKEICYWSLDYDHISVYESR